MRTIIHKLSMLGIEEDMPYDLKTRVKLINQINIATIIAGLFSLSSNIIFAQYELIIPGALSISIMALPLYFSSRKRYELASSFLLSTFGLTLLMMSILLGKQTQAYFAFFPAIVLSTLLVTGLKRYIFLIYYLALLFASFFLFADAEPFVIVPNPDLITLTVIVTSLIGSFYVLGFYNKMLETQSKEIERYNRSLEALVDERTHKLEDSLKELKRSNEDLEQFAYAASHDLQEPLRMIRNFSQLIERKLRPSFDEDTETYMHFIQEAVLRMSDLIKGLLAFSRVGRKEVQLEITDIAHLIQEKLKDLRGIIEEKKASIQFSDLPQDLVCEPRQLGLVFTNLIHNGLKFNQSEKPQISINAVEEGEHWRFEVADNGIGIQPEYQQQVFEIFRRLHRREEYDGTGLGLALCRKITERHGGEIWMSSEAGKGTKMFFRISKFLTPSENALPSGQEVHS